MTTAESRKPIVLIFKEDLLPLSETFIQGQARHLSHFAPRFVGLGEASTSLPVPQDAVLLTRGQSKFAQFRQKLYRRIGAAPLFHRQAAQVGARLIHAHFASGGRSAVPLARSLRVPLLVTLHGSDVTTRMNFRERYQELWKQAHTFICVSEFIRRKALEAGFPEQKLRVHYIGIDRDTFQPQPGAGRRDVVLFVGRFVEKKGCSYLLRAMAKVQAQLAGVETVMIGDGPARSSLEALAQELGLSCRFLGSQPTTAVREWLSKARVFCAPSVTAANGDSEGLPTVLMEAHAMGTPVVSTLHAGIPEIVLDGKTGLLAAEKDVDTLALHLTRLLEDRAFWSACSEEGIAWVRTRFDLKTQTGELEQIYASTQATSLPSHFETNPAEYGQSALPVR